MKKTTEYLYLHTITVEYTKVIRKLVTGHQQIQQNPYKNIIYANFKIHFMY